MGWQGLVVGLVVFAMIGVCHPLVIWLEYHVGKRVWRVLLAVGVVLFAVSIFVRGVVSVLLGGGGAAMFYSALEVCRQHRRAALGRARKNPHRPAAYYSIADGSVSHHPSKEESAS